MGATVSQRSVFRLTDHLNVGLNYTFRDKHGFDRRQGHESFTEQHRAELEIDPHWQLGESVTLNWRNRLEYRWTQREDENIRTRLHGALIAGAGPGNYIAQEVMVVNRLVTTGEIGSLQSYRVSKW